RQQVGGERIGSDAMPHVAAVTRLGFFEETVRSAGQALPEEEQPAVARPGANAARCLEENRAACRRAEPRVFDVEAVIIPAAGRIDAAIDTDDGGIASQPG